MAHAKTPNAGQQYASARKGGRVVGAELNNLRLAMASRSGGTADEELESASVVQERIDRANKEHQAGRGYRY